VASLAEGDYPLGVRVTVAQWKPQLVLVSAVTSKYAACLGVTAEAVDATTLLTPHGVLDSSTYLSMRDHIIKARKRQLAIV